MTALGITGSTGRLGSRVAKLLAASGVEQRLLVRDPSRAPELDGATTARMSYDDGAAVEAACDGLDTVLMVSASEAADRLDAHRSFVDAAARAGVRHLVYVSFYGAAADATFTLARLDEAYASRASYGAPGWQVDAWVSTYTAIAAGELAGVTGDVERLTGRPPTSLDQVIAASRRQGGTAP